MGRKHAIIIGLDYNGELPGCTYDAERMTAYLQSQGFTTYTITGAHGTAWHIVWALQWVCYYAGMFDEIFIHYSGHGTRIRDNNGDEIDGYDEAIVTQDGWAVRDDYFHALLGWIPPSVKVNILMDCCYSGTGMDVGRKHGIRADVRMISGCTDAQTSAEITIEGQSQGAMTTCFLANIDQYGEMSPQLCATMRDQLHAKGLGQSPVFSSSKSF